MTAPVKTPLNFTAEESSAVLFDYRLVRDWMNYVIHSVGRHPVVAIFCTLLIGGATIGAAISLPRQYEAKTRLLSNNGLLSAANAYGGPSDDFPAIAAREKILSHDNLETIVKELKLSDNWEKTRTPLFHAKDQLARKLTGAATADERDDQMAYTLEKKMKVKAEKGTIEISVLWPDPFVARQIVEAASQNFQETRHVTEVATKSETIAVLEGYRKQLDTEIEQAFGNLKRVSDERSRMLKGNLAADRRAAQADLPARPTEADLAKAEARATDLAQLKFQLRSRQRSIQDLEDWRTRSLGDLRSQLEQQRLIYRPNHPVIQQLESRIDSVSKDSPQLAQLRREETELSKQVETKGGGVQPQTSDFLLMDSRRFPYVMPEPGQGQADALERELARDPAMVMAQDALRQSLTRAQDLRTRIDAAKIELDSSRASYKYSFSVVAPPQTPRSAATPNVPLLIIAGMLAALLFSILACTALDVARGRVVEAWQIHRSMRVPVISSVRL
ncbi:MAG: hypothetical protein IPJ65_10100 [Archangiaceae bacterium]|nr:hypothetical protein [Archangiaceae bacterium]